MKYNLDTELGGHSMVFDGPLEIIQAARKGCRDGLSSWVSPSGSWDATDEAGRRYTTWKEFEEDAMRLPWGTGIGTVQEMLRELRDTHKLPTPKSRQRKRVWSETEGEVDVDRVLTGEAEYMRRVRREVTTGPATVALLSNLDAYGSTLTLDVFWRGAAAIAAVDLLEEAGYACEVWMWCLGCGVYRDHHRQFTSCKIKDAGAPVDIDAMTKSLSGWFLRTAVFGSFTAAPVQPRGMGIPNFDLEGWRKYMDISEGVQEIAMPITTSRGAALRAAKRVLEEVISIHER